MPHPLRKPQARRLASRALALLLALPLLIGAAGWASRDSWTKGMIVLAPSPEGASFTLPADAKPIAIERGEAKVRAWIFEPAEPARGTVLLTHGIRSSKLGLIDRARSHAASGLRAIAVDSRGHGESTGRYLTYGVEEARDLLALADALEASGLLTAPLSIVGSSYGAATALQYAAVDPRVARVVAMAPFASLREVVPAYIAWQLGPLARLVPNGLIDALLDGAVAHAGFDADAACPRCVAPRIKARVLLVHSRDDERIPFSHSLEIRDALSAPTELMLLDGVGHVATGGGENVRAKIDRFLQ